MTESPNPQPSNESNRHRRFGRVKVALGLLLLTSIGGGTIWGWWFVHRQLVPLVTRELSKLLNRPVKIGDIERVTLGSIRAGKSAIPATATDPDSVEMDGVKVQFNALKFLWSRQLDLDITLVEPTAYLERDLEGAWVSTQIREAQGEGGLIQIALKRIALEKGTVTLADPQIDLRQAELEALRQEEEAQKEAEAGDEPESENSDETENPEEEELQLPIIDAPPSVATFKRVNGSVEFLDENDRIKFETTGYPQSGRTRVRGEYLVPESALKLNVSGQNLPAGEASLFVDLPITIATGKVNTNLNIEVQTDGSQIPPNIEGNLRFEEIDAQIDNVPQPLIQADGQLRFSGSSILIEETIANYGLLPVSVPQGLINLTQGYEIPIQVQPTGLAQYLTTLELESPVDITGEAEAVLKVVGPIETPVLIGEAKTTDVTTIDRIPFGEVGAQFAFATAEGAIEIGPIQATPEAGGEIQGKVVVQLPTADNPDPSQNPPASDPPETPQPTEENGISPLPQLENPSPQSTENAERGENLPLDFPQSDRSPSNNQASENGELKNPKPEEKPDRSTPTETFEIREDSPLAPFVADEEITKNLETEPLDTEISPENLPLDRPSTPDETSKETETSDEPQPLIQGEFLALDVPGEAIAQLYEVSLPPDIAIGSVDAITRIAGPADNLQTLVQWEALNGTYPAKGEMQIVEAGILFRNTLVQVADSIVQGNGAWVGDRWEAAFLLDETPISALLPPEQTQGLNLGTATGPIQIAGTVDSFDLASIEGLGQLDLTVNGGNVQAVGRLAGGQWAAELGLANTPITPFLPPEATQGLNLGPATGQIQLVGSIDSFDLASIQGGGQLGLTVNGGDVRVGGGLAEGQWEAAIELANTPITPFLPPETTAALNLGPATGQIQLAGSLDAVDLASIEALGQLSLSVAGGNTEIGGTLQDGRWEAAIVTPGIPIANLAPDLTSDLGLVAGNVTLSGSDLSFDPNALSGGGTIGWSLGGGEALAQVALANGRWQADIDRFGLPLASFLPFLPAEALTYVPPELLGSGKTPAFASGEGSIGGSVNSLLASDWQNFEANGQVAVGLNGGGAQGEVTLTDGRWQANLNQFELPLAPFLPRLPGEVTAYLSPQLSLGPVVKIGKEPLRVGGSVYSSRPETLVVDGTVGFQLDDGQSEFVLDGEFDRGTWSAQTQVRQLELNTLFPSEVVSAFTGGVAAADIEGQLDGGLSLAGTLRDFTPEAIAATLQPSSIVEGGFQLRQFQVNDTPFDSVINGQIGRTREGLLLQAMAEDGAIVGEPDALIVRFGDTFLPTLLETQFDLAAQTLVEVDGATETTSGRGLRLESQTASVMLSARRKGNALDARVSNVPLSLLGLSLPGAPEPPAPKPIDGKIPQVDRPESPDPISIAGLISGEAQIDLGTLTGTGNIGIDRPSIGLTRADSLVSQFDYTGDSLALSDTVLNKGVSEYRLAGRVDFNPKDPQFFGSVEIESGQIQDVLTTLSWFEIEDLARGLEPADYTPAAELDLPAVGIPDASLLDQLRRFSEIRSLLAQQKLDREIADPLPGLYELEGFFNGKLDIAGSVNTGADVTFALDGGQWEWGEKYRLHQLVAVGSLEDGLWDFEKLDLLGNLGQEADTQLEFAGLIGGEEQSAQFNLVNLPLDFIEQFTEFPLGIQLSGNLNTSTTLSGSFANPQARGELSITDGVFNGEPLAFGRGGFSYSDARLNFGSQLSVEGPEPIVLRGSIPYEFPGSTVKPESEAFNLEVDVKNEGLAVLNLFNDQAIWESGQGIVDVDIEGERIEGVGYLPQSTSGFITIEDAVFSSPILPEPLTNVTGTLRLEDDTVSIDDGETLTGQFRQGQVVATGAYPLVSPFLPDGKTPLTVALDGVTLDLKGLYRGDIDGEIVVGGYFLVPEIGGEMTLSNGQVLLQQEPATTAEPEIDFSDPLAPVVLYDKLKLVLAPNTQILTPPVLNFLADGELTITGTVEDPRAAGTIFLRRGLVNLFTTQFTLVGNYKNTATFLPEQGLDPNLSVLMRAAVQEATRDRFPAEPADVEALAEIQESAIDRGTVQTVRIEAKVTGPASELANNLELTSRPARTQTEIVALMGGGFVNTLGRGDTTLALANLASSVLLTQIQSAVGQTLGLRDFRLFPAINSSTSTLTLGAEVGVDLTEDVSASILRILDSRESTRFNLRYRLSDTVQLRGSTDFDEDHRGEIELQFRF